MEHRDQKVTEAKWELDLKGIQHELKDNGELNGIDVKDEKKLVELARKVIENEYYKKQVSEIYFSDMKEEDKEESYYDLLWEVIDEERN